MRLRLFGKCLYLLAAAGLSGVLFMTLPGAVFHRERPEIFGWSFAIVLSGSMEPAFSAGDLIIVHREEQYRTGDIITFTEEGEMVTHRIEGVTDQGFITKGDANKVPDDGVVSGDRIRGCVTAVIPGLGTAALFLRRPEGLLVMALLWAAFIWGGDMMRLLRGMGGTDE
ncbi:MAG: signal peptidase I [Clostridium sp.]|nr:signal peptidase I [Clostridium sp.]